ncbi:MAG: 23S rRNA (uracil(1939)-C(5))-methyltransferase RlmD [Desulfovibrio sp.]|uniref:23S rRNA (uracil(1939)-C(5))-methyltransferase RlmD n=1 Tax=Desulfovibrio sp. 7SRBS1 TaxID=3378064 RepID=UPI003B3F59B2
MSTPKPQLKPGDIIDCTADALATGGKAVCRVDGLAVFVQDGLPGQKMRARVEKVGKRFAEAVMVKTLSEPDHPAEPFCPHFGDCGGCRWQHLDYQRQLYWKRRFVADSLQRLGGLDCEDLVEQTIPSFDMQNFRNKMEFAFSDQGPALHLGLKRRGSELVMNAEHCKLMPEPAMDIVQTVREHCRASGLPAYDRTNGSGVWRHLVLRRNQRGQFLVHLIAGKGGKLDQVIEPLAEALLARFDDISTITLGIRSRRDKLAQAEESFAVHGSGFIFEEMDGLRFRLVSDSFFQTNTPTAQQLYAQVLNMADLQGSEYVLDLFCGVGSIALQLARHAEEVSGCEISKQAARDAKVNAKANGLDNCKFVAGDVLKLLKNERRHPDVIVTDPPRSGMKPQVLERIMELAPRRIVYVSCDPATLGRDSRILSSKYTLKKAVPVDLFPHTPHVETAALFEMN